MANAYVLANVKVNDPEGYRLTYQQHVTALIEKYNGRFLVRGGDKSDLEGSFPFERIIVIEFPSRADAENWYNCPEYQCLLPEMEKYVDRILTIVDGID